MIKGSVRKLDKLGRIVPPSEYRKALNLKPGDEIDMYLDGNRIIVQPVSDGCICCGEQTPGRLLEYGSAKICRLCHSRFREVLL